MAKLELYANTAGSASIHTRRCQLMDHVQISEKFQSERLLFIDIGYHEKDSPGYNVTFCKPQPVANEVNF